MEYLTKQSSEYADKPCLSLRQLKTLSCNQWNNQRHLKDIRKNI